MGLIYSKSYGPSNDPYNTGSYNQAPSTTSGIGFGTIILILVVIFVIYLLYKMMTQNRLHGNTSVFALPVVLPVF